ncbi:MAG TPA: flippase-like domain-containing protein [Spirochaetota bacterium]|nr:flippase-like domain-containing protein [Spirochaetota bacterium]HOM38263.1 flippase-like domain-containing protein [Spirochaetota bacterium]HPQ48519.1 flippase-like domain-containing protein [Spirochaetota bacterium]
MKRKLINTLRLIFFIVGIGIIYLIGQKSGWDRIFQIVKTIEIYQIIIILLLPITWTFLHSLGWFILFDEKNNFKLIHIIGAQLSSTALSELLPLGQAGGEPYRMYFVRKYYSREKSPNIIASVILYNTIHTIATGIIIFIGFMFLISQISISSKNKHIFLLLVAIGAILLIFFIQRQKKGFMGPIFELLSRIKILKSFAEKKKEKAYTVDSKLNKFYKEHRLFFYLSTLILIIAKLIGVIEIYLILNFIYHPTTIENSFIIFSATSFVQIMFFFFPSQVGASEGSIVYITKLLGGSTATGMALAIIRRLRLIVWTLIGWIIAHIYGPKIHDIK